MSFEKRSQSKNLITKHNKVWESLEAQIPKQLPTYTTTKYISNQII